MPDLPPDLQPVLVQMQLCAEGLDEAPSVKLMGQVMRRMLPLGTYFVWAKKQATERRPTGEWTLIVMVDSEPDVYESNKFRTIHNTLHYPLPMDQLCRWFFDELLLI